MPANRRPMVRPRISYALSGHTKLRLGADMFHGTEGCDFGQFAHRDRIVMGVTWVF
jgi:hypothetical protein